MNKILNEMLLKYNCQTKEEYINAFKEIVQEIALYSLSQTDFFENAAFYGGTALRIFYGLDRFSEDLDFSLCVKNKDFSLDKYFSILEKTFIKLGLNFEVKIKNKNIDSNIQSAFLKGNTLEHILLINSNTEIAKYIQKNEVVKIKFEVDTNPPSNATYDYKSKLYPLFYKIKTYDESSLFAGKIHAVLCRKWKNRVKGRDLYDLEFYIKNRCIFNIDHLMQRMIQTKDWDEQEQISLDKVKHKLRLKIDEIDIEQAKKDVLPFLKSKSKLMHWNKEYFKHLIDEIQDNKVTIKFVNYDISKFAIATIIEQKEIKTFNYSNKEDKSKKYNELRTRFYKDIIEPDSILNFGNKINKEEECYIVKGFVEVIYLNKNADIDKIISLLKE